jgi:hypothetical protein
VFMMICQADEIAVTEHLTEVRHNCQMPGPGTRQLNSMKFV